MPFLRLPWLRSGLVFAGLLCFTCAIASAQPLAKPPRFEQPILVGTTTDSFPNSYVDTNGHPTGFSVDVLDAIAMSMGLKLERVLQPSLALQRDYEAGRFDMLQLYGRTSDRELSSDFSVPILDLQGDVFVRKSDQRFRTVRDLNQAHFIIIGHSSVGDRFVKDNGIIPQKVTYMSSMQDALELIDRGEQDAVFCSRLTGLSIIERQGLANIHPLGGINDGYEVHLCFAVHAGDATLLARLNEGLAILHRTGEYDRIYDKWYGRFEHARFSRDQVISYVASALALAFLSALWGLQRQRKLRREIIAQAEQLARSEAILAEAQQIAHVGHWFYDPATHRLTCSAEALRILDRDPKAGPPSYLRILTTVSRSERSIVHRAVRETLSTGAASEVTLTLLPKPGVRKIIYASLRSERDPLQRSIRILGTIQDITRRITAEEHLREREQLLSALYENAPSAIGVVEPSHNSFRFVSANPGTARLLGLESANLTDRLLSTLPLTPEINTFWSRLFTQASLQHDILRTERYLDATHSHYAITLVPLAGSGSVEQICYLVEDITERKQIDAEVAQGRKLRAVGELVGGIAHEFNNLLTPILLKTEMIASDFSNNPHIVEELHSISKAALRGADLTRRLLAFGRKSDQGIELVSVPTVLQANFDLLRQTIDRRISLINEASLTLPRLAINPNDLHQIVLNLLINARDALMEKIAKTEADSWHARIRVQATAYKPEAVISSDAPPKTPIDGWICITIEDNGTGMPREVQERIFEPFYTTKEVGKGTGLGLATVWHLVTRMGGKINLMSTPGEGTSFYIWLPIATTPATPDERPTSRPPLPPPSQAAAIPNPPGTRTLLVEDDDLVARTLTTTLRRQKHLVTHFPHGLEAWKHLSTNIGYELIILDLDLPGISGLEIARRLRGIHFTGKILVASGRLTQAELDAIKTLRIDAVLEKPFSPEALQTAIQSCLNPT